MEDTSIRKSSPRLSTRFFALLRFSLGIDDAFDYSFSPDEWCAVFRMAQRQAVAGVLFVGVQRITDDNAPPKDLMMQWLSTAMRIRKINEKAYRASVEAQRQFETMGFRCCVIKGQGNAVDYPEPYMRMPGDVDVWLDGTRGDIVAASRKLDGTAQMSYQHVVVSPFCRMELEVHFFPSFLMNAVNNRRMQRYFRDKAASCFDNRIVLPDGHGEIAVPTPAFNAVFQLTHVFRHYIVQGIGMRQLNDYYYVVRRLSDDERRETMQQVRRIGMYTFLCAVMYVMRRVFHMPDEMLLAEPDSKRGIALLREIMSGGNFGWFNRGTWLRKNNLLQRQWLKFLRDRDFLLAYPAEVIAEPFFRVYHFLLRHRNDD